MEKRLVIFSSLFVLLNSISLSAQANKYKLVTSLALQGTDQRIFWESNSQTEFLENINSEKKLPSLYFDLGVERQIFSKKGFTINTGLKYSFEWNNNMRRYNHCLIQGTPCYFVLLYVDGYSYHSIGPTIDLNFKTPISKKMDVHFGVNLSSMFRFLSYYDAAFKHLWKVDYLFSEISPHISVKHKNMEIGIFGRVLQHRKVDRTIYPKFSSVGFSVLKEEYMNINPLKIGLYMKFDFPFVKRED